MGRDARGRTCERLLASLEDCQRKHRHMQDVSVALKSNLSPFVRPNALGFLNAHP